MRSKNNENLWRDRENRIEIVPDLLEEGDGVRGLD